MATILLEVATPDKGEVFSGDINMLIVRSICGELGILPKHARLLTELVPHVMRIKNGTSETKLFVGGGFMEVTPEKITVLADSADFDTERAQAGIS
ncbi:MAG: ATP synthase F1 subunit epsilon [Quinella sp. 2Q5]|nr:ATP synthase F1 subunit epsilon [Quinella sp. 2Q5]